MRSGTSRDGRQQSRLIQGNKDGFKICTVDHQDGGKIRVDATITYSDCNHEVGVYEHEDIRQKDDKFFKVYAPSAGDDLHPPDENLIQYETDMFLENPVSKETKAWWYMSCGRVLGLLNGMMIEYDKSTLAPLGLVVGADELLGKRIALIDSGKFFWVVYTCLISMIAHLFLFPCHAGIDGECVISDDEGMEGADCGDFDGREQALLLIDDNTGDVTVVQPNEDGSYWRKIVRNKMIRMKEVRRERAAKQFAQVVLPDKADEVDIVSSWGPYTTTSGTAKKTGIEGLTVAGRK